LAVVKSITDDPVAGLIDIPLPQGISLWPETWVSRVTVIALLAAVVIGLWQFLRYRRANRYRREALAELARLERVGAAPGELLARLALLLRRTALAAFPREQVASLAGPAWLAFLDRTSSGRRFSEGDGRLLASAPYQQAQPDDAELRSLSVLVRQWIRGHHV
jgi:hypothetical protein